MAKIIFALFCVIALTSVCQATRYDMYSLFRVNFYTDEQFNMLYRLDLTSSNKEYIFWQLSHSGHFADIMVAPASNEDFLSFLDYNRFTYKLLIDDVQKVIDRGY